MTEPPEDPPEFGPRGYLPERAATRARKIVLRAPLGLQWLVAALVAGVLVVVAGVALLTGDRAPDAPYVEIADVVDVAGDVTRDPETGAWLVGLGGRIRAFATDEELTYCDASRRLESPTGGVWTLTGRATGSRPGLAEHPIVTADGVLYLDPSVATDPGPAADDPVAPSCA